MSKIVFSGDRYSQWETDECELCKSDKVQFLTNVKQNLEDDLNVLKADCGDLTNNYLKDQCEKKDWNENIAISICIRDINSLRLSRQRQPSLISQKKRRKKILITVSLSLLVSVSSRIFRL